MNQVETGRLLQRLRESANLTHEMLAETSNVSRQTISKAERGHSVRSGTLLKLLEAIGRGPADSIQRQYFEQLVIALGIVDVHAAPSWVDPTVSEIPARDLIYKTVRYLDEIKKRSAKEIREADRTLLEDLRTLSEVAAARTADILSE